MAIAALAPSQAQAVALVTYPLNNSSDGNNGFNYTTFDADVLSYSTIAKGPGLGQYIVNIETVTPSMEVLKTGPSSAVTNASAADALANNWYFTIALTPNTSMTIYNIQLDWCRAGSSGARGWFLRSSLDNYASTLYSVDTPDGTAKGLQPVTVSLTGFNNLTSQTTFRFYSYTSTTTRYVDFSNISFNSAASAAVPAPLPIFGVAAAFGACRRLRSASRRLRPHC